jgi:hypothetical protein
MVLLRCIGLPTIILLDFLKVRDLLVFGLLSFYWKTEETWLDLRQEK